MLKKTLLLCLTTFSVLFSFAQQKELTDFPKGYAPKEVGRLIAYRFVYMGNALHAGKWIGYPQTFYWKSGLNFAELTQDKYLTKYLQNRFELLFDIQRTISPVQQSVFHCLLNEIRPQA
ncbi:hypothetical protein [Sphingobacterium haloxyli]|uniref:Uncharacterized protein n=1 Tax=Sphingobacterium haloxyli TaxID=2100533 RepID=A0A2S9J8B9_9SPHI|nr:hypothetical protein [Sphingobacterium haloxyli]PRD49000.1 hypothetical protein C5745_03445 [Sphingobacterium haloxyli]